MPILCLIRIVWYYIMQLKEYIEYNILYELHLSLNIYFHNTEYIELNFFATLQWVCWLLRINFLWSKQLGLFRIPQRNIHRFIRQKLYVFYYLINSVNISKVEHSSIFPCDNKIFLSWNYLLVTEMSDVFSICIHRVI